MTVTTLERNPLFEHALTTAQLKDPLNYHSQYGSSAEIWLPFMLIEEGRVTNDAFILPNRPFSTHHWTWQTSQAMEDEPADLRRLGVMPWENGAWSNCFVVANADAFRLVEALLQR